MTKTSIAAIVIATTAAATLAFAPSIPTDDTVIRLEHDPDKRAVCLLELLRHEGHYATLPSWEYMNALLDYTDRQYGGPCAAADHHAQHGWH